MIKFSVIIPAYNAETTIERAVHSCLTQSFPPFEIIVVDDASTDTTLSRLQQFQNCITIIALDKNQGVSVARNVGWEKATGDYIAFLDSDDIWHPEKLKIISDVLQENGKIKVLYHLYCLDNFPMLSSLTSTLKIYSFKKFLLRNPVQTSCLIVFRESPIHFDHEMRYCEDHDLLLRLSYQYDCFELSLPLTLLDRPQLSNGGLSGQQWKMRKGEIRTYCKLVNLSWLFLFVLPLFIIFSFFKYFRNKIIQPAIR